METASIPLKKTIKERENEIFSNYLKSERQFDNEKVNLLDRIIQFGLEKGIP